MDYTYELYHWGIKDMKWGVRRYQNKDGTLTDAGKRRYARDQRENAGKKKGNKVGVADPNRWVNEDLERTRKLTNESETMTNKLKNINDRAIKNAPKPKMDLSNMSDKEMREQINRALLEKQYNDLFAPKNVNRGREVAGQVLEVAGSVLGVTGTALGIALAIRDLTGGKN